MKTIKQNRRQPQIDERIHYVTPIQATNQDIPNSIYMRLRFLASLTNTSNKDSVGGIAHVQSLYAPFCGHPFGVRLIKFRDS